MNLTARQTDLLKAIIHEYVDSTDPVGSQTLVEKYKLKISPATVRNEMVNLINEGFLEMLHTSSGRVPTTLGFRLYIDNLLEEVELPVLQEVAMKQRLWPVRFEFEKLLRHASLALSEVTRKLTVTTTLDGHVFTAGSVNLLEDKEFWEIDAAKAALNLLDNHEVLHSIFEKAKGEKDVKILVGEETGYPNLKTCCLVFAPYNAGKRVGVVCLVGPCRMDYSTIIPAVRFTKSLIEELGTNW